MECPLLDGELDAEPLLPSPPGRFDAPLEFSPRGVQDSTGDLVHIGMRQTQGTHGSRNPQFGFSF